MKLRPLLPAALLLAGLAASCNKDTDPTDPATDASATDNEWIHAEMKQSYLWLDEIGSYDSYRTSATASDFFASLISSNEKKTKNGTTYCYSYIEKKHASTTKVTDYAEDTYGIEYVLYKLSTGSYFARVLYVWPDSPAARAGIERGMWIKTIDGQSITTSNYALLDSGSGMKLGIWTGDMERADNLITQTIAVGANASMYETPFLKDTIFTGAAGQKIGYLCYSRFATGPTGFDDKAWNEQMGTLFAKYRAAGVSEFVLDLRYDPGGYIDCAILLSSYLIPQSAIGTTFCTLSYNAKSIYRDKSYSYYASALTGNLNLSRVYILAGERTASASEAVINGLKPVMTVAQIGATTEGKNLGSVSNESDYHDWGLHPIVASIVNAKGEGDYANGIAPTAGQEYDELQDYTQFLPLGSPEDPMTSRALAHMGALPMSTKGASAPSIAAQGLQPELSSIGRKALEGVRLR